MKLKTKIFISLGLLVTGILTYVILTLLDLEYMDLFLYFTICVGSIISSFFVTPIIFIYVKTINSKKIDKSGKGLSPVLFCIISSIIILIVCFSINLHVIFRNVSPSEISILYYLIAGYLLLSILGFSIPVAANNIRWTAVKKLKFIYPVNIIVIVLCLCLLSLPISSRLKSLSRGDLTFDNMYYATHAYPNISKNDKAYFVDIKNSTRAYKIVPETDTEPEFNGKLIVFKSKEMYVFDSDEIIDAFHIHNPDISIKEIKSIYGQRFYYDTKEKIFKTTSSLYHYPTLYCLEIDSNGQLKVVTYY